jgi:hypothetical protein
MNTQSPFKKLLPTFLAINTLVFSSLPVLAKELGSKPIEKLPNKTYLLCDLPPKYNYRKQAMCFEFKKLGNRIFGIYYPDRSDFDEICIEGTVKQNIITGWALEFVEQPLASYLSNAKGKTMVNWDKQGYLKVSKRKIVKHLTPSDNSPTLGVIKFDKVQLNLSRFYLHPTINTNISSCKNLQY